MNRTLLVIIVSFMLITAGYQTITNQKLLSSYASQPTLSDPSDNILSGGSMLSESFNNLQRSGQTLGRENLSELHGFPSTPCLPLTQIVQREKEVCPAPFVVVNDTILDSSLAHKGGRRIPRIVHVTAKSRCMPSQFSTVIDAWRFEDHSLFVHNDAAVDKLLYRVWPEFPQLQKALHCLKSGAAKADLWRALVLWEYGGIYTDIDNLPKLFNGTTIKNEDQSFFVVERIGVPSQYFMAAEPHHPLLYLLVQVTLHRLYDLSDVENQYVPFVTGPGALKNAFIAFMNKQNSPVNSSKYESFQRVHQGHFTGLHNRTATLVGKQRNSNEYVARGVVPRKANLYMTMNMTHFGREKKEPIIESCFQRLYRREDSALIENTVLW
jgi:mannosyltransferase OCH1-like enzyme